MEKQEALQAFGLASYEAKAYIAIVAGAKKAADIAAKSKVPRTRIYDVLKSLAAKGWINEIRKGPAEFAPNGYEELAGMYIGEANRKFSEAKDILKLQLEYIKPEVWDEEPNYQPLADTKEVLSEFRKAVDSSQRTINLHSVHPTLLKQISKNLIKASRRGVIIRVMLNPSQKYSAAFRDLKSYAKIKRKLEELKPASSAAVFDSKLVLEAFSRGRKFFGIKIPFADFIEAYVKWSDKMWETGEAV